MAHRLKHLETPIAYWHAPRDWAGQVAIVIGGGPSLLQFPAYELKRLHQFNCIAVNNAFMIAPWADWLVFHDRRWMDWHLDGVQSFRGKICTTSEHAYPPSIGPRLHRMNRDRGAAINCTDNSVLAGLDSGTMAVNLAYHFGASVIALLGFDMGFSAAKNITQLSQNEIRNLQTPTPFPGVTYPAHREPDYVHLTHWHQEHPVPARAKNYERFVAQYPNIIKALTIRGVQLRSLTPTRIPIRRISVDELAGLLPAGR